VENPRVLFLSKSSGFQHGVIKNDEDGTNHVGRTLKALAEANNAELVSTKDASMINAKTLEEFDLVIFYTTLNLTEEGSDGNPPMSETGLAELQEWIKKGGAFMGYHCATDTFHGEGDEVTPYIEMLGGEFKAHGRQFEGTVKVVDPTHPAMLATPQDWLIEDEWYVFKNLNKEKIHVLALLDPGSERENHKLYDAPNYPIIWVSTLGEGRIYYNAQGHREDVWSNPDFQNTVLIAATWALGNGPAQAEPNYDEVVKDGEE
jgi:hypothetical protein